MSGSDRVSITTRMAVVVCALVFAPFALRSSATPAGGQSAATKVTASTPLIAPEQAFGFRPGTDRRLLTWPQVVRYFDDLAKGSDKIRVLRFGQTSMGRPLVVAVLSSAHNLARLDHFRTIVQQLADPRVTSEAAAERLAAEGRVVVAIGCSVHASELGAAQMAPELAYELVTDDGADTARILDNVIFLFIPSLNPDGMDMVADWYAQTVGKPWEGAPMPWVYNKYVGHDINRDFFMLTQTENRYLAELLYGWQPQVYLSMHQMGENGPRLFVPPFVDPIDPNYEPLIWREIGVLGNSMAMALQARGMKGVVTDAIYDYYIPGYDDSAPLGHNTVCLLSEAASARLASPVTIAKSDLTGGSKGLPEYRVQQNFPDPWDGGTWRLRDIVDYDKQAALGLLSAAARYRDRLLLDFYQMGKNQVEKGRAQSPVAFVVPPSQRDLLTAVKMINILRAGAVEVWRAKSAFEADGRTYAAGSYVVSLDQPFRAYAKTLLEKQTYPVRKTSPGAAPERPYDVTGWTLPFQMGVETVPVARPFTFERERVDLATPPVVAPAMNGAALVVGAEMNDAFTLVNRVLKDGGRVLRATTDTRAGETRVPAGAFVLPIERASSARLAEQVRGSRLPTGTIARMPSTGLKRLREARVALYRPWSSNADEGWTRWLLEQYEFPFATLRNADIAAGGDLRGRFDVIVLPSTRAQSLVDGNRQGSVPPEYAGGIGGDGMTHLREFVEAGGTLVALGQSTRAIIDRFNLPVRDVLQDVRPEVFFCPGSILRTIVDVTHPVGFGMPAESIAVFQSSPAFEVTAPFSFAQPRVIARYAGQSILMSGWIEGEGMVANKAAAVDVPLGGGRVILFGFGVQNRAQPHATFKMLFNALMLTH